jgi:dTDP-4-dehydrorhamnose 3,5-epimerase-like enzyme
MTRAGCTRVSDCVLIEFPKVPDPRGSLTFIEGARQVPFEIKRLFYLHDVPAAASRGGHAHRTLEQVLICASGSLEVCLDDGAEQRILHLNRPWVGLYIPPMIWDTESRFEPGTVCLVLASDYYDESDYLRDYQTFQAAKLQSK